MQSKKTIALVAHDHCKDDLLPVACNRSTADFIFSSPLMGQAYDRKVPDFDEYIDRKLPLD